MDAQPVSDDRQWARKHRAILDAARTAFLSAGYLGTSMDVIALHARVSKQTVYKHFADKEALFVEIVITTVDEVSDPVAAQVLAAADSGDPRRDLTELARRQLTGVLDAELLALRRLVIAEATRFPDLGRAFYDRGPGRTILALTETMTRLTDRGALRCPDPALAAAQFNWLLMGEPLNQAMLLGLQGPSADAIESWATDAVTTFLAAYGG